MRSGFLLRKLPCSMCLPSTLALGGARVLLHHCPLLKSFLGGGFHLRCCAVTAAVSDIKFPHAENVVFLQTRCSMAPLCAFLAHEGVNVYVKARLRLWPVAIPPSISLFSLADELRELSLRSAVPQACCSRADMKMRGSTRAVTGERRGCRREGAGTASSGLGLKLVRRARRVRYAVTMASGPAPEQGCGGPPPHEGGAPHGGQMQDLRRNLAEGFCLSLTKYRVTRQVPCFVVDWCVRHGVCHEPWLWQAMQEARAGEVRQAGDVHEP